MIVPKFGCVALLDALGQRTASVDQAMSYLETLADIRTVVSEFSLGGDDARGRVMPEFPGGEFGIRFFADSILITLPFERQHIPRECPRLSRQVSAEASSFVVRLRSATT